MSVQIEHISAAQNGDVKAFEQLIEQSKNMVTSIALSIVKDFDASEDIAQKVYISCWKNLSTLKNEQSFLPWLRQSTRYAALNHIRDNKENNKLTGDEANVILDEQYSSKDEPDFSLNEEQQKQLLINALDDLPVEVREIVLLYYREEQSTKQVAELLSLSEAAVRKRLSRARELIKQDLLNKHGRIMLATAPTIAFTSMTLGCLSYSSPAAAAASLSTAGKTSLVSKFGWLFGGAFLGALVGALAVFLSTNLVLKNMTVEEHKTQLKLIRNKMVAWVTFTGILLAVAYELTSGWIAPVAAYSLFSFGFIHFLKQSQKLANYSLYESKTLSDKEQKSYQFQKRCGDIGTYLGLLVGFGGMLAGLIAGGRL